MPKVNTIQLFGNAAQSPKEYDRRKKVAEMLLTNGNERPVAYNFAQGLSIAAPKILGGLLGRVADEKEEQAEQDATDTAMKALTGGLDTDTVSSPLASSSSASTSESPSEAPSGGRSGGGSRALAANERRQRAIARLTERGYSPHAAEGVADNLFDESQFNTTAVGDNGTAFGIAQWRGPRFQNLKKFAASQGKDWRDFDAQVDFVDHEMKNGLDDGAGIAYA